MSKQSVIEFAEKRLEEEGRQNRLGADNTIACSYWAAYLDGARAQKKEDQKNPHGEMREAMVDLQIDNENLRAEIKSLSQVIGRHLLFSKRLLIEKLFIEWCYQNRVLCAPQSLVGFMQGKGWLNEDKIIEDLPSVEKELFGSDKEQKEGAE